MKRIISTALLCSLLFVGVSGCSTTNTNDNDSVKTLDDFFTTLQNDAENLDKIEFVIEYQDLHYELKESDKYDSEDWMDAEIQVTVDYDYKLATDEDWYKACPDTKLKTLNTAFFNEYKDELSEGHFSAMGIVDALYFSYAHSEDSLSDALTVFYSDYEVLKQLVNLTYVKYINVQYIYSMPRSYFME